MAWNGWDTDATCNIQVFPVIGWSTAAFMKGMAGGLRIEFTRDPSMQNNSALQVVLTAPQVRELSQTLAGLADKLEAELAADKPSGAPS
jgi:hypothetical protein